MAISVPTLRAIPLLIYMHAVFVLPTLFPYNQYISKPIPPMKNYGIAFCETMDFFTSHFISNFLIMNPFQYFQQINGIPHILHRMECQGKFIAVFPHLSQMRLVLKRL